MVCDVHQRAQTEHIGYRRCLLNKIFCHAQCPATFISVDAVVDTVYAQISAVLADNGLY